PAPRPHAPLDRTIPYLAGVGAGDCAELLAAVQVALRAPALFDDIPGTTGQHAVQLAPRRHRPDRALARASRGHAGQAVHDLVANRGELLAAQVGRKQPDAARDVEAHPAR